MERPEGRLAHNLGLHLHSRLPSSDRLFDLCDNCWFRLWLPGWVSVLCWRLAKNILHFQNCLLTFDCSWFIVASATVVGSLCSFIVSRTILSRFVHRLIAKDKRFAALSLTLKHDGLKLLCMIRLCPLPYSISNGALSTFPTVQPLIFALATAIVTPKLLIHVFIGSRLAAIARSGEKMDGTTKAINYASIVIGAIIGIGTGWFIYQR